MFPITLIEIEKYLLEVKKLILLGRYTISLNYKRKRNNDLFLDYLIDEAMAKSILLDLSPLNFLEILRNEHKNYEHELLYVFGKDVFLAERFGLETDKKLVLLYIKLNKIDDFFVIIISIHEQDYPARYYFK